MHRGLRAWNNNTTIDTTSFIVLSAQYQETWVTRAATCSRSCVNTVLMLRDHQQNRAYDWRYDKTTNTSIVMQFASSLMAVRVLISYYLRLCHSKLVYSTTSCHNSVLRRDSWTSYALLSPQTSFFIQSSLTSGVRLNYSLHLGLILS